MAEFVGEDGCVERLSWRGWCGGRGDGGCSEENGCRVPFLETGHQGRGEVFASLEGDAGGSGGCVGGEFGETRSVGHYPWSEC